ncbi:MAG: cysteine desulfurase [Nitrospinota bacterium]|nr:cysteine desulfurase [Nitrospinota bacterium]
MIYLDNAATTPMDPEVIEVVQESMRNDFANSGTVYSLGLDTRKKIELAEEQIRNSLLIPQNYRIIFTSGGTESNNLFIKGYGFPDKKMAYLGLEHPSITQTLESFRELGNKPVSLLSYQKEGRLDGSAVTQLKKEKVRLLCLSHVNNELGSVNDPVPLLSALAEHSPQTRLFLDGVQAVGKVKLLPDMWRGLAGYSISGHKLNGPKGIGLLVFDGKLDLKPQIHGGQQQHRIRSGTLPVPLILGLAHAIKRAVEKTDEIMKNSKLLFQHLTAGLKNLSEVIPELNIRFNSSLSDNVSIQSPSIVNFRFVPVEGEVMLHHLEEKGIYVGLGSACSAHSKEPSKVLTGIGLTPEDARCSLRISFGHQNTIADIDAFLEAFGEAYRQLYSTFNRKVTHQ